jgi:hypothetical protein
MMLSLQQAQNEPIDLRPEQVLQKYGMSTIGIVARRTDTPMHIKLVDELSDDIYVPFAPSVFGGGSGDPEQRKGLALSVPTAVSDAVLVFEAKVRDLLRPEFRNIDKIWNSAIKEPSRDGQQPLFKAKIRSAGRDCAQFFDQDKKPAKEPEEWRGVAANVCFSARGCYIRKDSAGLQLDVTHVIYGPRAAPVAGPAAISNPF